MDMFNILFYGAIVVYLLLEKVLKKREGATIHLIMAMPFLAVGALLLAKAGVMVQGHESIYDPIVKESIHIGLAGMAWATLGMLELVRGVIGVFVMVRKLFTTRPARQ